MVLKIKKNNKKYFQCEECRLYYINKEIAKKCEDFCKKNKGCSLEIIRNSVKMI